MSLEHKQFFCLLADCEFDDFSAMSMAQKPPGAMATFGHFEHPDAQGEGLTGRYLQFIRYRTDFRLVIP